MAGQRVRRARLSAGLTQADLARRADVARRTVAYIEAGQVDPLPRVRGAIATALEVDVASLWPNGRKRKVPVIVEQRRARSLSARAAAAEIGVSTNALLNLEAGRRARQSTIDRVAVFYGLAPWSPDDLPPVA
jgi:transcriptional regulator with XRE-family HTH domain